MLNSETKKHIDAARDVLVGVAPNPTTQIDQITYALIYKFMDDMDQAALKAGGEASFFTGNLERYSWSKLIDSRLGNQEKLNLYSEALVKFSESPQLPELFRSIFRSAYLPYRSPETLGLFLKEINYFDYSHPEELGNAYEYLLSIMSSQGDAGQFRTPRHIIDFIVDVVNPLKDDRVLDPACGTAGFLVSTYNHILEQHDGVSATNSVEKALTPDERKKLMQNLNGYDIDPSMVRFGQVNMFLHNFKNPQIYQYDSLTSDDFWNEKFDVILANPPFMTPTGGIKPHNKFAIKSKRAEVLFVDYILNHLKPNGRAGIVVYEPVLYQKTDAHISLRKQLLVNGLFAVVSLPRGVFEPYSGVKTSILFFDKSSKTHNNKVFFAHINNDGYELSPSRKPIEGTQIPEVLKDLLAWKQSGVENENFVAVEKSQILEDETISLIANRFLYSPDEDKPGQIKIGDILQPLKKVLRVGKEDLPILSITMSRGLVDQNEKFNKRIASADISNYKKVLKNDLVIGFPIDEGVLGFQRKYEAAAVSPAYEIWRLTNPENVNVRYLEILLRSQKMREVYKGQMQNSVSRRRSVPQSIFMKILLDLPDIEIQNSVIQELERLETEIENSNKSIFKLFDEMELI